MNLSIKASAVLFLFVFGCRTTHEAGRTDFYTVDSSNQELITRPELCEKKGGTWKTDLCVLPAEDSSSNQKASSRPVNSCSKESQLIWDGSKCISAKDPKNFYLYCKDTTASEDIKATIKILTKFLGKIDCDDAYSELKKRPDVDLSNTDLVSLEPLYGLPNLTALKVSGNKITDLTVLKSLKESLSYLDLSDNPMLANLTPVASLSKLQKIYLTNTHVSDLGPLQSLALVDFDAAGSPIGIPAQQGGATRTEAICPNQSAVSMVLRSFCQN